MPDSDGRLTDNELAQISSYTLMAWVYEYKELLSEIEAEVEQLAPAASGHQQDMESAVASMELHGEEIESIPKLEELLSKQQLIQVLLRNPREQDNSSQLINSVNTLYKREEKIGYDQIRIDSRLGLTQKEALIHADLKRWKLNEKIVRTLKVLHSLRLMETVIEETKPLLIQASKLRESYLAERGKQIQAADKGTPLSSIASKPVPGSYREAIEKIVDTSNTVLVRAQSDHERLGVGGDLYSQLALGPEGSLVVFADSINKTAKLFGSEKYVTLREHTSRFKHKL